MFQSVLCLSVCQFEPCVSISAMFVSLNRVFQSAFGLCISISDMFVSLSVRTVCFNQCCLSVCQFEPCVSISDMFVSLSVRTVCFNQ